jgi:glycosyltransferase involved in cell wall biosynthesis
MERCLSWMSDAIIAVSPEERNEALALGIASKRLFLILSGIKTPSVRARAEARACLGLAADDICVGYVGRLARQKAPERLLAAFAAAARRVGKLRLLVIGDGELAGGMRIAAADLAIDGRIIWTGEVPSSEFFAAIDIFVLPSRFEGLSYSTMEAMAIGIPVVATDAGGTRSLVAHRSTGVIVAQGEEQGIVADLASAIAELASDDALRREMSLASLERSAAFEASRMVEEVLELYGRLRPVRAEPVGVPSRSRVY